MYSFKEKKTHFVALRNPDVAQYDLELLAKEVPGFPQLATFSRNPKRYADDILYALLDCATREKIREYRRAMIAKKAKEAEDAGEKKTKGPATKKTAGKKQQMPEGETTHTEETGPHDDVEKPETAPADNSAEELKQVLEEAEARAEEAEQRADEAEEARDEAEARARETEQALEEEKKKSRPKKLRKSPKARGIPANRLGQPLRPASPNSHTHLQRPCGHLETDEAARRKSGKKTAEA